MGFPGGSVVKNLAAMQETQVPSLGWEDPLEKRMATHLSILAWRIPWKNSLAVYRSWGRKESDTTEQLTLCNSQLCDMANEGRESIETMYFI